MPAILTLQHLTTGYPARPMPKVLSEDLSLTLQTGDVVMLMGPNGSGKSTLLHTIAGLLPPLGGDVLFAGRSIASLSLTELALQLSLVLTERLQTGLMTVEEVVRLGRTPHTDFFGRLRPHDREQVAWCIARCGLETLASRPFATLSDGEKQRTLIARALAQETPLILLDEPTAHLDLSARLEVVLMLRELARELEKGVLISTHELELALSWADRLWLMDRSGQITDGLPEDLALGGELERVFGSERLSYDLEQGRFFVYPETTRQITLTGDPVRCLWTSRALQRIGYATTSTPAPELPRLSCEATGWRLTFPAGSSYAGRTIEDLLPYLAPR